MLIVNYLAGRIFMNKEFLADVIEKLNTNELIRLLIEIFFIFPYLPTIFYSISKTNFDEKIQY